MVEESEALPGRSDAVAVRPVHATLETPMTGPYPPGAETVYVAMGCFWGAEKAFFTRPGVITTAVGYQGGFTINPTYEEVCTGRTGHTEAVLVVFDPTVLGFDEVLALFFEGHDPTQGHRQGNDVGTQYRSAIFTTTPEQLELAQRASEVFGRELQAAGFGEITTEIGPAGPFYFAEDYHQQYLVKNPNGYCGIGGTGVSCPVGLLGS
jgi:peptide-methionine (S)-S-oxide reductase